MYVQESVEREETEEEEEMTEEEENEHDEQINLTDVMHDKQWSEHQARFDASLLDICSRYASLQEPEFGLTWAKVAGPRGQVSLKISAIDADTLLLRVNGHRIAITPNEARVISYLNEKCYISTTRLLRFVLKSTKTGSFLTPLQINRWRGKDEDHLFACEVSLPDKGCGKFMLLEHMAVFLTELPWVYSFWYT